MEEKTNRQIFWDVIKTYKLYERFASRDILELAIASNDAFALKAEDNNLRLGNNLNEFLKTLKLKGIISREGISPYSGGTRFNYCRICDKEPNFSKPSQSKSVSKKCSAIQSKLSEVETGKAVIALVDNLRGTIKELKIHNDEESRRNQLREQNLIDRVTELISELSLQKEHNEKTVIEFKRRLKNANLNNEGHRTLDLFDTSKDD